MSALEVNGGIRVSHLLPSIKEHQEYHRIKSDPEQHLPAVKAIAQRHGVPLVDMHPFSTGSTIVYGLNENTVLKLYSPLYPDDQITELGALQHVSGRLDVPTPDVLAHGFQDGWPYLVMSRLSGHAMIDVWDTLTAADRLSLCTDIARILAQLHGLPVDGLQLPHLPWDDFLRLRIRNAQTHHKGYKASEALIAQLPGFLNTIRWDTKPHPAISLLHTECHFYHILVEQRRGTWSLSGLIDFEPAMIGDPEYDLANVPVFLIRGDGPLLRAFLQAYGYPDHAIDPALVARMMGHVLLHRYCDLAWYFRIFPELHGAHTLEELQKRWFPI